MLVLIVVLSLNIKYHCFICCSLITCMYIFTKLSQIAQELKSNLKPNINDTLMHYLETSTTWL